MADLSDIQAAGIVKITGSDSVGVEQTPVQSTSNGALHINVRNNSGTEIGTISNPISITANPIATNGTTKPTQSLLVAGSDGTSILPLLTDNTGRLVTSAITGFGADFSFGDITTASLIIAAVRRTVYTEQTTNAQRSIVSANANDSSAGTGARTVEITYLDQVGAGPYTETITMNGATPVNTVSTTICFIEKIKVLTVGSTGSNVGILTLRAATGGGGVVIWTVGATDNQTFGSHHYIPTAKTCNITGMSVSHNGTTVGSGGVFILKAKSLTLANAAEIQVNDSVRLYGQASTSTRSYGSPIKILGPARIYAYVTPETASSTVYRASFDFFEP